MNEWLKGSESVILEYKWWKMVNFGFGAVIMAQIFLKWLLYGDVSSDLNYFEVKETSITIDILCRIICNNSKRDLLVKKNLAKHGHEDNDSYQQHFHSNDVP